MRLKVTKVMDGPGPGEVLIEVQTSKGNVEEVIVHVAAIEQDSIEVGNPIHREEDSALIELPREAMSGSWRIWVPMSAISGGAH